MPLWGVLNKDIIYHRAETQPRMSAGALEHNTKQQYTRYYQQKQYLKCKTNPLKPTKKLN